MTLVAYYISWSKQQDNPPRTVPIDAQRAQIRPKLNLAVGQGGEVS
jgi:hypothetical protein